MPRRLVQLRATSGVEWHGGHGRGHQGITGGSLCSLLNVLLNVLFWISNAYNVQNFTIFKRYQPVSLSRKLPSQFLTAPPETEENKSRSVQSFIFYRMATFYTHYLAHKFFHHQQDILEIASYQPFYIKLLFWGICRFASSCHSFLWLRNSALCELPQFLWWVSMNGCGGNLQIFAIININAINTLVHIISHSLE